MHYRGKDYTGETYNKLTFIRLLDIQAYEGRRLWELQCECGTLLNKPPNLVCNGHIRSCPDCRKSPSKNWTGIKLHHLTFVRPSSKKNRKWELLWEAECDCIDRTITIVRPADVANGNTTSCGCYKKIVQKNSNGSRANPPVISTARAIWSSGYKDGDITFDEFFRLSQLPCRYCGRNPFKIWNVYSNKRTKGYVSEYQKLEGNFTYNGLDRVDSNKGHTLDNVVTCCTPCNTAKSCMTVEEFILHNERQYLHMAGMRAALHNGTPLLPSP